jgi:hypothetical protein
MSVVTEMPHPSTSPETIFSDRDPETIRRFHILDPGAVALSQGVACLFHAVQKAQVVFEPMIEPTILGPGADPSNAPISSVVKRASLRCSGVS